MPKPASSSTICTRVQTVPEVIPGAGLAAFAAPAWRAPRRSVFTGSKARKDGLPDISGHRFISCIFVLMLAAGLLLRK